MNFQILSYEQIINILQNKEHKDYDEISSWFGDLDEGYKDDEGNYEIAFSEDCIEVRPDEYFMLSREGDFARAVRDLDNLKEDIDELLKFIEEQNGQ